MRVAMLVPVILVAGLVVRARSAGRRGKRPPLLPWFVVAFVAARRGRQQRRRSRPACARPATDAVELVPGRGDGGDRHEDPASGTSSRSGLKPVLLMVAETLFIAGLVLSPALA